MRLGFAGGVIVVLVALAIVIAPARQPAPRPSLRAQSPWSTAPRWVSGTDCQCSFAESRVGLLERGPPSHVSDPGSDQESCCEAG